MKLIYHLLTYYILACFCFSCTHTEAESNNNVNLDRAQATLDSIYTYYGVNNSPLLRETFPFESNYTATYLASEEQANRPNAYAYLWPYSGTFSAVSALYEATQDKKYKELLDEKVLKGLEAYYDCQRTPCGYASYINDAAQSDRFYDDNVWLGIDFTDMYLQTQERFYLEKAQTIWQFIISGMDNKLGGGIYWCEQDKSSKNTCSNAPGSVYALKLFKATGDSIYFNHGKNVYEWTQQHLQDPTDYLYYDNIKPDGRIGKAKYAYNSGQMMQAAALLYQFTGNDTYLTDARQIARSCYDFFFDPFTAANGDTFKLLCKGDIWFTAVMLRGFIELYHIDQDATYIDEFRRNLDYAWLHSRDENGLFSVDWSGEIQDHKKWLLTQAAMVEMYARIAML